MVEKDIAPLIRSIKSTVKSKSGKELVYISDLDEKLVFSLNNSVVWIDIVCEETPPLTGLLCSPTDLSKALESFPGKYKISYENNNVNLTAGSKKRVVSADQIQTSIVRPVISQEKPILISPVTLKSIMTSISKVGGSSNMGISTKDKSLIISTIAPSRSVLYTSEIILEEEVKETTGIIRDPKQLNMILTRMEVDNVRLYKDKMILTGRAGKSSTVTVIVAIMQDKTEDASKAAEHRAKAQLSKDTISLIFEDFKGFLEEIKAMSANGKDGTISMKMSGDTMILSTFAFGGGGAIDTSIKLASTISDDITLFVESDLHAYFKELKNDMAILRFKEIKDGKEVIRNCIIASTKDEVGRITLGCDR